jgi:hypothetical protein
MDCESGFAAASGLGPSCSSFQSSDDEEVEPTIFLFVAMIRLAACRAARSSALLILRRA